MFTNSDNQDNLPSCDCLLQQEAPNFDLGMACHSFDYKMVRPCIHRDVERCTAADYSFLVATCDESEADLVPTCHSYCCSDCADKVAHFVCAVVAEDKTLDVKGDHCFPEPNATPFAFSDPIVPRKKSQTRQSRHNCFR